MSATTSSGSARYDHPSAWRGVDMAKRTDWLVQFGTAENKELRNALAVAKSRAAEIPALSQQDFPLPTLGPVLTKMRDEVVNGRGFALVRGLSIEDLPITDAAKIYWGIGSYIGRGRAQNAQGDLLGHVTDLGLDIRTDPNARGYQTRMLLPFHNDAMDIVGLLCWMPAQSGGLSRIVSSTAIYNTILEHRPDLLDVMSKPMCVDRRGEAPAGKPPYYQGAFFEWAGDRLFCRYNRTYIESAQRFPEVPQLTPRQIEALNLMDELCNDPKHYLDMKLERGDMQFISNYSVLHSRTSYVDAPEQEKRRYLLRLWLDTGLIKEFPASYVDRFEDTMVWQQNPRPPVFDLSLRHAALSH